MKIPKHLLDEYEKMDTQQKAEFEYHLAVILKNQKQQEEAKPDLQSIRKRSIALLRDKRVLIGGVVLMSVLVAFGLFFFRYVPLGSQGQGAGVYVYDRLTGDVYWLMGKYKHTVE